MCEAADAVGAVINQNPSGRQKKQHETQIAAAQIPRLSALCKVDSQMNSSFGGFFLSCCMFGEHLRDDWMVADEDRCWNY